MSVNVDREVAVRCVYLLCNRHSMITMGGFQISLLLRKRSRILLGSERPGSCLATVHSHQHRPGPEPLSHFPWHSTFYVPGSSTPKRHALCPEGETDKYNPGHSELGGRKCCRGASCGVGRFGGTGPEESRFTQSTYPPHAL